MYDESNVDDTPNKKKAFDWCTNVVFALSEVKTQSATSEHVAE